MHILNVFRDGAPFLLLLLLRWGPRIGRGSTPTVGSYTDGSSVWDESVPGEMDEFRGTGTWHVRVLVVAATRDMPRPSGSWCIFFSRNKCCLAGLFGRGAVSWPEGFDPMCILV